MSTRRSVVLLVGGLQIRILLLCVFTGVVPIRSGIPKIFGVCRRPWMLRPGGQTWRRIVIGVVGCQILWKTWEQVSLGFQLGEVLLLELQ